MALSHPLELLRLLSHQTSHRPTPITYVEICTPWLFSDLPPVLLPTILLKDVERPRTSIGESVNENEQVWNEIGDRNFCNWK